MPYYHKIPYVRCECGFRKDNTEHDRVLIESGDYCPRCGTQLTGYNELHRQSMALAGQTRQRSPPSSGPSLKAEILSYTIVGAVLAFVYAGMRYFAETTDNTITINGEVVEFFSVNMVNTSFSLIVFVMLVVFAIQHAPGFVKGRWRAA